MAITAAGSGEGTMRPRCALTRKLRPSSACAAVAPRHTMTAGFTAAISASSQGRQARISCALGFSWMRRLPTTWWRKCLTALVR